MKNLLLILSLALISTTVFAKAVHYKELPSNTFFKHLNTNLDSLFSREDLKNKIEKKYLAKELNHYYVDAERTNFIAYWKIYQNSWHSIDLNNDGTSEIIFQGVYEKNDQEEYTEIYIQKDGTLELIYLEQGELNAYQINPFTNEIDLFTHEYPCCEKYIHNIVRLRLVQGKIKESNKVFLGREGHDMQGPFFPSNFKSSSNFEKLSSSTPLYWSDSIVKIDAYKTVGKIIPSNKIATFPEHSYFKVLGKHGKWTFVLISAIATDEKSQSINTKNIEYVPIYGWMRLED